MTSSLHNKSTRTKRWCISFLADYCLLFIMLGIDFKSKRTHRYNQRFVSLQHHCIRYLTGISRIWKYRDFIHVSLGVTSIDQTYMVVFCIAYGFCQIWCSHWFPSICTDYLISCRMSNIEWLLQNVCCLYNVLLLLLLLSVLSYAFILKVLLEVDFFLGLAATPTSATTSGVLVEASEDDGEEVWLTTWNRDWAVSFRVPVGQDTRTGSSVVGQAHIKR